MFHNSSRGPRVSYSVGPAKVKYLAIEDAMAFGFESIYCSRNTFLVVLQKDFPPNLFLVQKQIIKVFLLKKVFDFQSEKEFKPL